jgi:tRNA-dihydrouridine synthase 2
MVESTGVSALTIHARTRDERPRDAAHWDQIKTITSSFAWGIPLVLNGDVWSYSDFERARVETGVSSVMTARGAMKNASIFRPEGMLPLDDVMVNYCKKVFGQWLLM